MYLTPVGLIFLLCAVPVMLAGAYDRVFIYLGVGLMLTVTLLALLDAWLVKRTVKFEVRRIHDDKLSVGVPNTIILHLYNRSSQSLNLLVKDCPPPEFITPSRIFNVKLAPWSEAQVQYQTTPPTRGVWEFNDIFVRGLGVTRLAGWQKIIPACKTVKVYPNLIDVRKFELLSRRQRLQDLGIHTFRRRGEGTVFESLRDYMPDDEFSDIDWKATARRQRPVTRLYEVERNQNLMLMIDAGRMMCSEVDGLSRLDYAVSAALLLAHVAASWDDFVGLLSFGREVKSFVPLARGKMQTGRIMEQLYDLQPTLDEPDYRTAFATLTERARKRSLVVVFSDLVDADASQRLLAHLMALRPRHLPLLITLRDTELERIASSIPTTPEMAYERGIAANLLATRENAIARLRQRGVLVVNVAAEELSVATVNEYLRLKSGGVL